MVIEISSAKEQNTMSTLELTEEHMEKLLEKIF